MNKDGIFNHIKTSFDSLWLIRPRGNSFEIITPFPTSDKFVSVFLTQRDDKYVVTDGGMIFDKTYVGDDISDSSKLYKKTKDFLIHDYNIAITKSLTGKIIYYKSTTDEKFIPNLVFDVGNFVATLSSMTFIINNIK